MSIFSYEQTLNDIKEGATSIPLICLKCKKNMAVTNYSQFGCQNCQARYTFESYQLQFNSMFMSLLLSGGASTTPVTESTKQETTVQTTSNNPVSTSKIETPHITFENMFDEIYGESLGPIKSVLTTTLQSKRNLHVLLDSPPGQSKTIFLLCIGKMFPDSEYLDCSMLTKAGLGGYLAKHPKTKLLRLDEIDKMEKDQQMILLNLMATGILRIEKHNKSIDMHFPGLQVIATCNEKTKLYPALLDRFLVLTQDKYTKDEYCHIGTKILEKKYKFTPELTKYMVEKSYDELADTSIRQLQILAGLVEPKQTKENVDHFIGIVNNLS